MKPTSIVSLIISVILIIVGLVTCFIAQNMAQEKGEYLFAEERNNDLVQTVDLSESEISKIELIVADTEINIIGKSERSYIEFINFRENYYALSATNRVLSFDEIPDVMSMLKFWENGFSFKGMRYIFNFNDEPEEDRAKVINIYLTSDYDMKIFDITAENAVINIENMTSPADYNIITDNAVINTSVLRTTSSFNINTAKDAKTAESITLNMKMALISNININAANLELTAESFRCNGTGNIVYDNGNVDIKSIRKLSDMNFHLTSEKGFIEIDGNAVTSPYITTNTESSGKIFKVETETGTFKIAAMSSSAEESGT